MIDLEQVLERVAALEAYLDAAKGRSRHATQVMLLVKVRSLPALVRELVAELRDARTALSSREPRRIHLPDERTGVIHKFTIHAAKESPTEPHVIIPYDVTGYLNIGNYPDGTPGEVFIRLEKEHSKLAALLDQFAIAISMLLQVGFPLRRLVQKFRFTRFEPSGRTDNPLIPSASSPTDYIFALLEQKYLQEVSTVPPNMSPQEDK
jgi:ribonucleoside-diphosphate reductase alpha chain